MRIKQAVKFLKQNSLNIEYKEITEPKLLNIWTLKTPHFGGDGPHRYDGTSLNCAYCLRPKNFKEVL